MLLFLLCASKMQAQGIFIIEGDTLQLKQEVRGNLSLFWDQREAGPRYFVQKSNRMLELKDSLVNGGFQYRSVLERLTSDKAFSAAGVEFTMASMTEFVRRYNIRAQEDRLTENQESNFSASLGFYTGLTNSVYSENPNNVLAPLIGAEFEMRNPSKAPRHSAVVELEQTFKRDDYRYTATQLSVNYRFRFLELGRFQFYAEASLLRLLYALDEREIVDDTGEVLAIRDDSQFKLQAPLSLGLGVDLKVTQNSYITFKYNEFASATLDSNGSFPLDFTVGYKYNL